MIFAFLTLHFALASAAPITQMRDLDGDGKIEKLVLDPTQSSTLTVWRGGKKVWQGIPKRYAPWKLTTGDVDGDGKIEIALGVHKATRFFPKPHNCCFVWGWDGRRAYKKWLGSALSKPFSDFAFGNLDSDRADELIALATRRDGKKCVVVYSWNGFGFDADWESGAWNGARLIGVEKGKLIVVADGRRVVVTPQEKTP